VRVEFLAPVWSHLRMDEFLTVFDAKRRQHEAQLEELQRGGRVIGSPMSPTPDPEASSSRDKGKGHTHKAPSDSSPTKRLKKKKKRSHRKNIGSDETETAATAEGDHARSRESKKKHKGKKKSRSSETNGVQGPEALDVQGIQPSARQLTVNGIARHETKLDREAAGPEDNMPHIKAEPDIHVSPGIDVPDHELPFRIADNSIVDGYQSRQKSPFIHKREMSIAGDRSDRGSDEEELVQTSQVKPEPNSSESESDSASPSVARLARLSRSRSRSVSRPPPLNQPTNGMVSLPPPCSPPTSVSVKLTSAAECGRPSRITCTKPIVDGVQQKYPSSYPRSPSRFEGFRTLICKI
jgi:hypothetical protein